MPNILDEPADDIAAKLAQEIPPGVVGAIMRDLVDWILLTFAADKALETDERVAIKGAADIDLRLVTCVAGHLRGQPGFPAKTPGAALKRLVAALTDRDNGKSDQVLSPQRSDGKAAPRGRPTLSLNTQLERVEPAVAMELIMARNPQSPEDAAKEVLDLVRESHAAALVRQWRTLKAGGDSTATEIFNDLIELARREVGARGMTADAYSAVIRTMLIPKN